LNGATPPALVLHQGNDNHKGITPAGLVLNADGTVTVNATTLNGYL
jgi:hypothetical protein